MRTTVNIQEDLLRRAKEVALRRGCTLGEVIEHALRSSLASQASPEWERPTRLPTFRGRGVQPGVDLNSSAGLLEVMEER